MFFFNLGHFFTIGGIFLKLGAKNYFGIEKISYFGNYMDPCRNLAFNQRGGGKKMCDILKQ